MKEMARLINVPFIELHEESHVKDSPPHYEVNPIGVRILTVCRDEWKHGFLFYPEGGAPICNKSIGHMCNEFTTPEEFAKLRPELAKALGNVIEGPEMLSRLDGHFRNIQALGGLHSAN